MIENIDYVECKICCEFRRKKLTYHIENVHNISKDTYREIYGEVTCSKTKELYSNTGNYDWINRAKSSGKDLSLYLEKLGRATSLGIMKSHSARLARSKNLSRLNKTDQFRKKSSIAAKATSLRPDIIESRTANLARWRDENPEEFYEKCTSKMHSSWQSKPEKLLFQIVNNKLPHRFERNQQIRRIKKFKTVRSGTRQIDILDKIGKVVIEFDGIHHFKNMFKTNNSFEKTRERDAELNAVLVDEGYTVIRIAHDRFSYKSGGNFDESSIEELFNIIAAKKTGLFLIGEGYQAWQK